MLAYGMHYSVALITNKKVQHLLNLSLSVTLSGFKPETFPIGDRDALFS
jgi:hypothetical protein